MVQYLEKNILQIVLKVMNAILVLVGNGVEILSIIKTIYNNSAICTKPGEPFRFARFLVKL